MKDEKVDCYDTREEPSVVVGGELEKSSQAHIHTP